MLAWNDIIGQNLRKQEGFERRDKSFLLRFLKPGMTVLDIGAHHGPYTLLASMKVSPYGHVVSLELFPRELQRLHWNLLINWCRIVCVIPSALDSSEGVVEFFVRLGQETGCNSLHPPAVSER